MYNVVARDLGVSATHVKDVYQGYWMAIRKYVSSVPLKENIPEEEFNKLYSENGFVEINAVCQCRVNEWCGSRNPQLLLVDYEVVDSVAFIF